MDLECILHLPGDPSEKVKPLDSVKWEKLKDVVKTRKEKNVPSKYDVLIETFPDQLLSHHGYHSKCYKNFTAVPKQKPEIGTSVSKSTRRSGSENSTSSTGVLPPNCIFCGSLRKFKQKKMEEVGSSETSDAEVKIREVAREKNDTILLSKIGNYLFGDGRDFVALEAKYHHSCRRQYLNGSRELAQPKAGKTFKADAMTMLFKHIHHAIIVQNIPELVSSLMLKYKDWYVSYGGSGENINSYSTQNLCKAIQSKFPDEITIQAGQKGHKNMGSVVFKQGMTFEEAFEFVTCPMEKERAILADGARILRRDILGLDKSPLNTSSVDNILEGEVPVPSNVLHFYQKLYAGDDTSRSLQRERFINSSAADAVYCCSGTKLIPGKHIGLGLTLKSMTGSKNVVTLLQRNGHCCSSETTRRIDMGMESSVIMNVNDDHVPDGVIRQSGLCTGLAFDNFDINMETLSGLGTIHHTYGIVVQNILSDESNANSIQRKIPTTRQFSRVHPSSVEEEIEPYHKKPKISEHDFDTSTFFPPKSMSVYHQRNILWMAAKTSFPRDISMWHGWNSLHEIDVNPKQKVFYMKHIPLPPTRNDVVKETLKRSQSVAEACGEKYALVTYDLALAKIAMQIQAAESPAFDNVFVMFGSFHTEMSFFGSLGRFIEGSGGPYVMTESNVIAAGSLNKFLKGKMYNRCRRVHILFSTAMHSLHFEQFLKDQGDGAVEMEEVKEWCLLEDNDVIPVKLETLAMKYNLYCEDTLLGVRGKTAQYWLMYCHMMDMYMVFHHAMKMCDVDLFTYMLHEISKVFFSTNHINYARWMSRYSLQLLNIHPTIRSMLWYGGLSVRRSDNNFGRVGVDMALEQTINAEAKNRLKGIMAFADVNTAVNRWLVTSSMRTEISKKILEVAGMSQSEEDNNKSKEVNAKRQEKDAADLISLKENISDMVNPFDPTIDKDILINIKTGRKASELAEQYLLSVLSEGESKRDNFLKECEEDPKRFEKSIKKTKIVNFATEAFVHKNKSKKAQEIVQLKGTRDLFARLLYIAITKSELNLEIVLSYPLTPFPAELAHPDGTIRTTNKSSFMDLINLDKSAPIKVDNAIIDGMFFLRGLPQPLPHNLRGVVRHILVKALKLAKYRVDLSFDVYNSPCIKDIMRDIRADGDNENESYTFGGGQMTPKNFMTLLKSSRFKKEFLRFFVTEIKNDEYAAIIGSKVLHCSVDNECIRLSNGEEGLEVIEVHELYGAHEEADTRVAFHALHADQFDPGNTVIRCNDTDIKVIMLANAHKFMNSHVWLDVGLDHNNSRHYIDIKGTAENLTAKNAKILRALPGIYGFSGLDFIPSFMRKGKKKPFELMLKNETYLDAFSRMGEEEGLTADLEANLEAFTCALFGYPKLQSINEARHAYCQEKCSPDSVSSPLEGLKAVDPSLFPPCQMVLVQQIKRTWLLATLYKNATEADPLGSLTPLDFGYELTEHGMCVNWYDGEQVPPEVDDNADENSEDDNEDVMDEDETDDEYANMEDNESEDEDIFF